MRRGTWLVVGAIVATSCHESRDDGARSELPSAEEALTSDAIPEWAAGHTFSRDSADFYWFHVNPDGTTFAVLEGGDVGSRACVRLRVENGRLLAPAVVDDFSGEGPYTFVRTVDGRYFAHVPAGYLEFVREDLCARGGGSCGGHDRVEACTPEEKTERTTAWNACPNKLADAGTD